MSPDLEEAFEAHFRMTRAIDSAWRQIKRRRDEPEIALAPAVDGIMAKCGGGESTRAEVRRELERRIVRYRPRRARRRP